MLNSARLDTSEDLHFAAGFRLTRPALSPDRGHPYTADAAAANESARAAPSDYPPPLVALAAGLQGAETMSATALAPKSGPSTIAAGGALQPNLMLINLDDMLADARFGHIDGTGVSIVIIDTGIDLDHPFFGPDANNDNIADRIVFQYDFGDGDGDASDPDGHGTHVAGIAASSDATYRGIAPGANIIMLKGSHLESGEQLFSASAIEAALSWTSSNVGVYNIVAVNLSLGGGNYNSGNDTFQYADEIASLNGASLVTVVAAAGNRFANFSSTQGVSSVAATSGAWAVGAVFDRDTGFFTGSEDGVAATAYTSGPDRIAPFSQRSVGLLDIFAPGVEITNAGLGGGTTTLSGTSMASPHIAGIAALGQALVLEMTGMRADPDLVLLALMKASATTIFDGDDENDNVVNTEANFPRVDVYAFMDALYEYYTTPTSAGDNLRGANGQDSLHGLVGNDTINGRDGNDTLYGDEGADWLIGGEDNDVLYGGAGADGDQLEAGPGDDILEAGDGNDTIDGGLGSNDWALFPAPNGVNIDLVSNLSTGYGLDTLIGIEHIVGSEYADTIVGNAENNFFFGTGGADRLHGQDGADTLRGGAGNDFAYGGTGADSIFGDDGADSLEGDAGADTIFGGDQNDTLFGEEGNDSLEGENGADSVHGGTGNDTLWGGSGNDTLDGSDQDDFVLGGADNDVLYGGSGDDVLNGENHRDTLYGGLGADVLWGGDDNDTLIGGPGADDLDGGAGVNTALFTDSINQVVIDLATGQVLNDGNGQIDANNSDTITNIQIIYGGQNRDIVRGDDEINYFFGQQGDDTLEGRGGDDELHGDDGDDELRGGDGNDRLEGEYGNDLLIGSNNNDTLLGEGDDDTLLGGDGDDSLHGGSGADSLSGDDGADTLDGSDGDDTLLAGAGLDSLKGGNGDDQLFGGDGDDDLNGGADNDTLDGGAENDILFGGNGNDSLVGGVGDDTLAGQSGNDTVKGGGGNDKVHGNGGDDKVYGGSGDDKLTGSAGADTLNGADGNDEIFGNADGDKIVGGLGNDKLVGLDGDDNFYAGGGNDTLKGGEGNDTLLGGGGADQFEFETGTGQDIVTDFSTTSGDVIRLKGFGAAFDDFADVQGAASQIGDDTVIDLGGGDAVTLVGVTLGNLSADDFLFG